ncbi:hypothetical protein GQ473_03670 [archaeon]|nr:hypothetical protein [archaeon]
MNFFEILIYPGILFILFTSLFLSGIFRKITARMQSRIGPPIIQPFYDTIKLFGKENIRPAQAKNGFHIWPIISLTSIIIAALMIPIAGITALNTGDLLIVLYFVALSSITLYIAGFSTGNPFGHIGATRGIIQMVAYEFPLILSVLMPAVFLKTLSIDAINLAQITGAWNITLYPIAGIIFLTAIIAALELPPFHIPQAHQEIVGGYTVEYTGTNLAYIEISHMIKMFVLITLAINTFLGGAVTLSVFLAKTFGILIIFAFIRTLLARLRINHVLKFYWILGYLLIIIYSVRLLLL